MYKLCTARIPIQNTRILYTNQHAIVYVYCILVKYCDIDKKKIGRIKNVKKSSEKLKFQQIFIDGVEQTSYFIDILIIYDFSSTQSMNIN